MEDQTFNKELNILRDSSSISPWQTEHAPDSLTSGTFNEDTVYDVLIVGGGITGITTALLLQQEGKKCVVADAHNIGYGTTGGTSAHLNTFFDSTYPEIESNFSEEAAKLVAKGGKESFGLITGFIEKYGIDCEFEYKDAYLFSEKDEETKQLEEIYASSQNVGITVRYAETINVPVSFKKAILFDKQGQFHPLKYINALAAEFVKLGGIVLENTFIRQTSFKDGVHIAESDGLKINAKNLVYATHLPPGINILDFRCAPYRSYVLGLRLKDEQYPDGLAYDMQEPYHYFRTHKIGGKSYLLLGGEDHKTGHEDPEKAVEQLEEYARKYYNVESIDYKWSSQYYVPADGLPYIGLLPSGDDRVYIATGYNGNGMMFGTLSAKIIADLISNRENDYADLYSPSRIKPIAGFMDFVSENADVVKHFVSDRFGIEEVESLKQLPNEQGEVIEYKDQKLAVYKDAEGHITALNPVCTHTKCIVNFNAAERSWDCPCHGGRFDLNGKVLTGPPRRDLQQIALD